MRGEIAIRFTRRGFGCIKVTVPGPRSYRFDNRKSLKWPRGLPQQRGGSRDTKCSARNVFAFLAMLCLVTWSARGQQNGGAAHIAGRWRCSGWKGSENGSNGGGWVYAVWRMGRQNGNPGS